ncbi:MAG: peptide-methionine (R)-S-oxide reductase MsrB [Flavobacteriaceae bacterium]|nr:peptide-methionine (R)-S-oxide reductase MsrB [Flavobacteriaceae bacterium]
MISKKKHSFPLHLSEEAWREKLDAETYRILRQKGTEFPHSGKYNLHFENGIYCCAGCGSELFNAESKFDSHCGWPAFDKAIPEKVTYELDKSFAMLRTEILCSHCGGHLGHVFDDGPTDTGKRYCVNSLSLNFDKDKTVK